MKDNVDTAENMIKCEIVSHQLDESVAHHADNTLLLSRMCVVVGGTSLAVFCAEQIQSAGHIIQAVLPTDSILQSWAEQQGINWVNSVDELQEHMLIQPIDWLFSISNPIILPELLIQQIHGGAFNYHDSPLPCYAGNYATFWALLARETSYAISWHCIDGNVNTGNIAVQWPVSIEEDDTTFLLNLKCYQAAQKGFNKLLKDLSHGTLITYPQDLSKRSFYALSHQLSADGYICWEQPSEILSALVRALNFGENYVHPFGYPKLLLKQDTVRISWLQRLDICSGGKPGTLIHVDENSWQVTTGSKDVRIGGFFTLEGQLLSAKMLAELSELTPGTLLSLLSSQQAQNIKNKLRTLAPYESFWYKRLTLLQPTHLPFDIPHKTTEPHWVLSPWQFAFVQNCQKLSWKTLLQAFVIYLSRLTQQTMIQVGWAVETNDDLSNMASVVPMTIETAFDKPWHEVAADVDNELILLAQYGTYSRDLFSRFPTLHTIPALRTHFLWPIAVSVVWDNKKCDQERFGELLTLQINTQGDFRWIYDENRLSSEVILRMSEHLQMLLSSNKKNDEVPVEQLNLLPESERTLLLETWNTTDTAYPEDLCIHQLFEQQVVKTPAAIALVYENLALSYTELNARSNRLAHQLIDLGVGLEQRVAICVSRSPDMIVGLLAVLKAGGAYVPLDPAYPPERLDYMLKDSTPVVLITQTLLIEKLSHFVPADLPVLLLDAQEPALTEPIFYDQVYNTDTLARGLTPDNLAYVIYTSGSTGLPKGVEMPQAVLSNLLHWHQKNQSLLAGNSKTLQFSALGFDVAFQEIFTTLCEGGCLFLISETLRREPQQLLRMIQQQKIERIFLPYIALQQLADAADDIEGDIKGLAHIITAGEQLQLTPSIRRFLQRLGDCRLHNHYGSSETHDVTTYILGTDNKKGKVETHINQWPILPPIGRPIGNARIYILDRQKQLTPLGAVGELYIGGLNVARGYLNRPELTAERFLSDPYSDKPGARMYRTGDLARYQ
ncbi:amino acid adenylation domain-containing protein, partial [Xenorhabdus littoralis]|uniref:amino acid adenylation domain-containing protein n=1 Tax=Xenorhabdus littoralis TaxID=2582835 RepID=UPI0029E8198B